MSGSAHFRAKSASTVAEACDFARLSRSPTTEASRRRQSRHRRHKRVGFGAFAKSTYSTKAPTRAVLGSAMATRELLNVRDTARALHARENTVRNWEERGILRAARLPGMRLSALLVQDVKRLRAEVFEEFAPATDGSLVSPGRKRSGRLASATRASSDGVAEAQDAPPCSCRRRAAARR